MPASARRRRPAAAARSARRRARTSSGARSRVVRRRPAFVGIDDEPGARARPAHRLAPGRDRRGPPSFSFSSGRAGVACAASPHLLRRVEDERIGRDDRPRRRAGPASSQTGRPARLASRSQKRAVERVARRPGGQRAPAAPARPRPPSMLRAASSWSRSRSLDGLAVARDRARIRRGRCRPSLHLDVTTSPRSCEPREIVKTCRRSGSSRRVWLELRIIRSSPLDDRADAGAERIDRRQADAGPRPRRGSAARLCRAEPGGVDRAADEPARPDWRRAPRQRLRAAPRGRAACNAAGRACACGSARGRAPARRAGRHAAAPRLTPAKEAWNSEPWPSIRSQWSGRWRARAIRPRRR